MNYKLNPMWWIYKFVEKNHIPKACLPNPIRIKLAKYIFENVNNRKLDLKSPKRFSEKIVWYMLYYDNLELQNIICKIKFKDYVKRKLGDGYTAKLYGSWKSVEEIDWDSLPQTFVLKSNCNSFGRGIMFIDGKNNFDFDELKDELKTWFVNKGLYSFDRGYYNIEPQIMAEEMLGIARNQPVDYKFFCFDGEPKYCYSAFEHFDNGKAQSSKIAFYDSNWNVLPVKYKSSECVPVEKPKHFELMKEMAAKLSNGLPFVRVDFYETKDKPLVGEMTFYSGGMANGFTPDSFDFEMGSKFNLPNKTKFKRMKKVPR